MTDSHHFFSNLVIDDDRSDEFFFMASDDSYYKNDHFIRLLRNWNKYMEYEGDDTDEMYATWEETLLNDFLKHSKEWLAINKNKTFWKKELI